MKFGIATFNTDDAIDPVSLATAVEDRGFASLMLAEHTHIPISRKSPYPGGGELPDVYYRTLDPFVSLAAAAAVTSSIELTTGVTLLIERDPIVTAKEAASIDLISGGRFVFGVGAGWNLEEMANHGTDPKTRGALLDERIEAVKALWTTEPAEYHGELVDIEPSFIRPKPVQQPHPPIFIGGGSKATVKRIVRHQAGWMSVGMPAKVLSGFLTQLRDAADHEVPLMIYGAPVDPEYWQAVRDLGFGQIGLMLPSKPTDETLRLLDEYADAVQHFES